MTNVQVADGWIKFSDLLEARARYLKSKGLDASAIAMIGASTDAMRIAQWYLGATEPEISPDMRTT